MTVALVNLADIKAHLDVRAGVSTFDAKLKELSLVATSMLETYCRQEFDRKTQTDYFGTRKTDLYAVDLFGGSTTGLMSKPDACRFRLSVSPVDTGETMTVYYDPDRLWAASTALDSDEWYYDDVTNTVVVTGRGFGNHPRSVKIDYTAGYAITLAGGADQDNLSAAAPDDLKLACVMQTVFMFQKSQGGSFGVLTDEEGGESYASTNLLIAEAMSLAKPYRRVLVGKG